MSGCKKCNDEHYILLGCCSGQMCGCMGQPVSMTNCDECNPDGDKPLGDYVKEYAERVEYVGVEGIDHEQAN